MFTIVIQIIVFIVLSAMTFDFPKMTIFSLHLCELDCFLFLFLFIFQKIMALVISLNAENFTLSEEKQHWITFYFRLFVYLRAPHDKHH